MHFEFGMREVWLDNYGGSDMYKACIFDLDGTLLNTIHALTKSVNQMLEYFHYPPIDDVLCKQFVGEGYKKLVERALKHGGDSELVHYEEALQVYQQVFEGCCMYKVAPYDGIKQLLERLKQQGIKTAVLSNKPHDRTVDNIEGIFGKGYFDCVYGQREGIKRKPDPEGALLEAEEMDVKPEECLYIGDTSTDMQTGIAAGMDTVGVLWGFRSRDELEAFHPCLLAKTPEDIDSFLFGYWRKLYEK